jgi:glycosyltransferase involved in cell wall biosynthesis
MRIGLNLLYLLPGIVGGTQVYAENLIRAMAARAPGHRYVLFLNEEARDLPIEGDNIECVVCPVRAASRARRYAYEQLMLPGVVRRHRIDVLHSLGYVGPWACPCPHVVTIHDVNFIAYGDRMPPGRRHILHFTTAQTAQRCQRVIAVSEFGRSEIVEHLRVPSDKVTAVPEAARVFPPLSADEALNIRRSYGLDAPYIAAFTSVSPNKNIDRLLEAFDRIAPRAPHRLLLIGHTPPQPFGGHEIVHPDRVVRTGYVPDEHVPALLGGTSLFAFPSLYEGFGLPVLEAQTLGVPVACSIAASLPEVAGDAAEFFDPHSTDAIAAAILRLLSNEDYRQALAARGRANAARFSWGRAADETLAVYERVLDTPGIPVPAISASER